MERSLSKVLHMIGVAAALWITPSAHAMDVKATVLTVDTRDSEACYGIQEQIQDALGNVADICVRDDDRPMVSIFRVEPVQDSADGMTEDRLTGRVVIRKPIHLPRDPAAREMVTDSGYYSVLAFGMFGVMLALPGDMMNWEGSKSDLIRNMPSNWQKNASSSPVMDKDGWAINLVGHPLSGAAAYGIARHNGTGIMGSFGYAVLMSTFLWEYGLESTVERPSIQDLLITPIVGSILGELFHRADKRITENEGKLLGSKKLGTAARLIMNPAIYMVEGLKGLAGEKYLKSIHPFLGIETSTNFRPDYFLPDREGDSADYVGIRIGFSW
ncbi:MAG: hypothetical protein A2X94_00695 [Bdellovibrionales bacterium GWB1_55_8]|nr:MAG: hypothetical protein A2X94_00695 [Bdellovibrionales bacterium GWB1_55_8]